MALPQMLGAAGGVVGEAVAGVVLGQILWNEVIALAGVGLFRLGWRYQRGADLPR